jgi:hypothetical protein
MQSLHLYAAWIGIFFGFLAGAGLGLFFHQDGWLGGYSSWPRRMARLGHISFFGIALINLAYGVSLAVSQRIVASSMASALLICGAISMPLVCFLSAYKKPFRHLFFIPVLSLMIGTLIILMGGLPL